MFGMGFGELLLVVIVAVVVIGPKELPRMLRSAGQWAGKLRRMALDLRVQSGIDDVLKTEGLTKDLQEIRKLARGELDGLREAATVRVDDAGGPAPYEDPPGSPYEDRAYDGEISMAALRHREYPREGADAYEALPDTAVVYASALVKSPLARDPLYVTGDPNAELPPLPVGDEPATAGPESVKAALLPTQIPTQAMPVKASEASEPAGDVARASSPRLPSPDPREP